MGLILLCINKNSSWLTDVLVVIVSLLLTMLTILGLWHSTNSNLLRFTKKIWKPYISYSIMNWISWKFAGMQNLCFKARHFKFKIGLRDSYIFSHSVYRCETILIHMMGENFICSVLIWLIELFEFFFFTIINYQYQFYWKCFIRLQ